MRSQPQHEPTDRTRRQVELCAAFGNTENQIAAIMGITVPVLKLHYATELEMGLVRANTAVKTNLWVLATRQESKAVRAIELWLKYVERREQDEGGPKPKPLGKKEQAIEAARLAHEEGDWGDDLIPPSSVLN